jgi:hypothetical protein
MKKMNGKIIYIFLLTLFFSACSDLEVEYLNNPDRNKSLSDSYTVFNIAKGSIFNWYMNNTSSLSPRMALWVASDQGTCSWANSGMLDFSIEPRSAFNNHPSYTYANVFENYWENTYSNLSQVNDVLNVLEGGMKIGVNGEDTEMVRAISYYIQGLSLGYIGLTYDKAYIMLADTDPITVQKSNYPEVIEASVNSLNKAIEICHANQFVVPADWFNGSSYTNEELEALAHSYIARFMVQSSRTKAENDALNWATVLTHTEKGIQRDLRFLMDEDTWKNWFFYYTVRPGWAKIDLRIINLMDNTYPKKYPETGIAPTPAVSNDRRLESDFNYVASVNMKPERGYYHYSNYEYARYDYYYLAGVNTGNLVEFYVTENKLMQAEALMHLNRKDDAIAIINAGTRTLRGGLQNISAMLPNQMIYNAIFYERDIELMLTGFGTAFFDMRRRDMLQKGTPLHLPIPGGQLMLMGEEIYTFGGVSNADGVNVSNGGWFE